MVRVESRIDRAQRDEAPHHGETFQKHRHYDRATVLLQLALKKAYSDDLQFALGRSYFGAEKYAEAQAAYLRGAGITKKPEQQCTFFWHAARAAQLRGDDKTAEQLMTRAIAVKGKFPATLAALTQRLRTRLKARRFAEAGEDGELLGVQPVDDVGAVECAGGAIRRVVARAAAQQRESAIERPRDLDDARADLPAPLGRCGRRDLLRRSLQSWASVREAHCTGGVIGV